MLCANRTTAARPAKSNTKRPGDRRLAERRSDVAAARRTTVLRHTVFHAYPLLLLAAHARSDLRFLFVRLCLLCISVRAGCTLLVSFFVLVYELFYEWPLISYTRYVPNETVVHVRPLARDRHPAQATCYLAGTNESIYRADVSYPVLTPLELPNPSLY